MARESGKINLLSVLERVVVTEQAVKAAHQRMDTHEQKMSGDLKKIDSSMQTISDDLKKVIAWMNRSIGWASAAVLASGFFSALIVTFITRVFFKS